MKILAIYDNGGSTFDRYSIYLNQKETDTTYMVLGMSENPNSPMGFCQHSSGMLGKHNGKRISKEQLPIACQEVLTNYEYI